MKRHLIVCGLFMLALTSRVPASLLQSTPFDSSVDRTAVERINLWPFFYCQAPSWSVLWPMID